MTFSELRLKDVINICEGRRLGRPIDVVFNEKACIDAIVVPGPSRFWSAFRVEREGFAIPWTKIRCIGDDVILVDIEADFFGGTR